MTTRGDLFTLTYTATSPATAVTAVADPMGGLDKCDYVIIDASLAGGTGGTLDIYLQREIDGTASDVWADWYHFAQLSAGSTAKVSVTSDMATTTAPIVIGIGTLAVPAVALAANTLTAREPMGRVRMVFVAGASTSAGAAQTIRFSGRHVRI